MYCRKCGVDIGAAKNFCHRCGTPVLHVPAVSPVMLAPPARPPGSSKKAPLVILIGCFIAILCVVIAVLAVVTQQGQEENEITSAVTGEIHTSGSTVDVASEIIPSSGGTLTVRVPGDPLDGMRLEVPAGAYEEERKFRVSESKIDETTFGPDFEPVSPLIDIDNGGGYSEEIMLVSIPIEVPADSFAMAFYYDEESGQLEGIQAAAVDGGSLTIATRHFSEIVVARVSATSMQKKADQGISVGFKPGRDDWQFVNMGTYIADRGICSGMSVSSMWYFEKKKAKGAPGLYGQYDNDGGAKTPGFWLDDWKGIRLASVVQRDIITTDLAERIASSNKAGDLYNFRAIAGALFLTGRPVFLLLRGPGVGHAVVAYRVKGNRVYIADPNRPGETRWIELKDGRFQKYQSVTISYETIIYIGTWSVLSDLVMDRWEELEDGVIGNGWFPPYVLETQNESGEWVEVSDGFVTSAARMNIRARATKSDGPVEMRTKVFKGTSELGTDSAGNFSIEKGENALGVLVEAQFGGDYEWCDFKRLTIKREAGRTLLTHTDHYASGKVSSEYTYYLDGDREVPHGYQTNYTESGYVSGKNHWVDGVVDGLQVEYFYESEQPSRTWEVKKGVMEGTYTEYNLDGTIRVTVEYKNGVEVPGSRH